MSVRSARATLTATVTLAVVVVSLVALLGSASNRATVLHEWCEHVPCASATPTGERPAPLARHDVCLHEHACGGGAALTLGMLAVAAIAATRVVLVPPRVGGLAVSGMAASLVSRLPAGGLERPPRLAH